VAAIPEDETTPAADENAEGAENAETSENAEGEETEVSARSYRRQTRGGLGILDIRTSKRNGDVIGVAVDDTCATDYTNLYALDADGSRTRIAQYHPAVSAPRFHRYEIQNMAPHGGVDLLVEVRLDPLPLVHDTDIVPFDSLEPIEWMMQASWYTKSGEIDAAQKMHALATNWLRAREITEATVQTPVIVNSLFPGSPGEVSMEAVNI
jgi:hypothetical protein